MAITMQRILVIDDDDNLRDTIGVLFEREGFVPILAADGKSGFDRPYSAAEPADGPISGCRT